MSHWLSSANARVYPKSQGRMVAVLPRGVARIGLALTVVFVLGSVALADPKEDVLASTSEWGRALGEDDPDKVLPFYADDAVLWAHFPRQCELIEPPCETISSRLSEFYPA